MQKPLLHGFLLSLLLGLDVAASSTRGAANVGFRTEEGQRRLQAALREARDHERATSTNARRPNGQWRY